MVDRAGEQRYGREINSPFAQFYAAKRRHDVNMALARRRQHALGLTSPVGGADSFSDVGFNSASLGFGILDPILRAADSFVSADRGLIPQEDMIGEAFNVTGVATAGASAVPVKGAALRANNLSGLVSRVKPPTKEELDPLGYQKTKMRKSLFNTEVDEVDLGENLLRIPRSWEEMENRLILPFYGDRTSRGMEVRGVDDMVFDTPVYTEGGVDFMRGPAAQADRAIWASNSNIIKRIADEAEAARKAAAGEPVFGMTGSMAPDANDFAVHTGSVMAEMVKKSKINRETAASFNDAMRVVDETFPGIRSPKLREWVDSTTSPKRKMFIRLMDSAPMQAGGMPSPAQARYAATDATQRNMGSGQFGMGVAQLDELSPILRINPEGNRPGQSFPHRTYNTQITGDYFGSLPPVPQGLLFKDVYDRMEGGVTKKGQPYNEAHKTHAIKTIMPVQRLRPEIIEGILDYLQRTGN